MAKLKVKKLEPIFSYRVNGDIKGLIDVYAFDTDFNCYFIVAFTQDGPHDEKIYVCIDFKNAKQLVEYACDKYETTTAYEPNPFKTLLDDKAAMERLQQVVDYIVEGEWWRT